MKTFLCLCTLLIASLTPLAHARGFIGAASFPLGTTPFGPALADMNNDGILDVVTDVSNGLTGFCFEVSLGNGDGTFQPPIITGEIVGNSQGQFVAGDVNGDGNTDVITYIDDQAAFVLLGDGAGHLTQTFTVRLLGVQPQFMLLADFNGDGKLDYAITYFDIPQVGVALGNGDGTFQAEKGFKIGPAPLYLAAADLNRDGKMDLAATSDSTSAVGLYVALGKGDGTFQAEKTVDASTGYGGVVAVDLNRDGIPDVVAADNVFNVDVFLGKGDGTYQAGVAYPAGSLDSTLASGDMNGDGKPDVVVGKAAGEVVLLGNGDGTLQPGLDFATSFSAGGPSLGDVNGDGSLDVVTVDSVLNEALVLLNDGQGSLHAARSFFMGNQEQNGLVADVNGDNKPDAVALIYFYNPGISVGLGNGDGTVQPGIFTPVANITTALAKGDFNRDGKVDLVVGQDNGTSSDILILQGKGDGAFTTGASYPVSAATVVATGDLNGDGKTDIVVASAPQGQAGSVTVFLGNGDGTFTQKASYATGTGAKALIIANVNQDGKLDVLIGDYSDNPLPHDLYIYFGNGDGTMQTPLVSSVGGRIFGMAMADLNQDGKNDLVVNTVTSTQVRLGNGDGTFQSPKTIAKSGGIGPILGDVNGDGKLDIISSLNDTTVWLGKGDGTFRAPLTYSTGDFMPIGLADFNGDKLPDILTLNWSATDVTIVLNTP